MAFKPVPTRVDYVQLEHDVQALLGRPTTSCRSTCSATRTPTSAGPSSTGRSRPTTPWASTTPGAAPTRTSTTASRPCAAASCATRTASTARASGSRSRSRRSWASRPSATSSATASPSSSRPARSACSASPHPDHAAVDPPRLLDGLGQQLLHHLGREQLHDLGLPQEVLARRAGSTRATTPCPGARAAAPASRSTEIVTEGYQEHHAHQSVYLKFPSDGDVERRPRVEAKSPSLWSGRRRPGRWPPTSPPRSTRS